MTPEGIVRSEEAAPRGLKVAEPTRKWVAIVLIAAVLAAGLLAFQFLRARKSPGTELPRQMSDILKNRDIPHHLDK